MTRSVRTQLAHRAEQGRAVRETVVMRSLEQGQLAVAATAVQGLGQRYRANRWGAASPGEPLPPTLARRRVARSRGPVNLPGGYRALCPQGRERPLSRPWARQQLLG